MKTAQEEYAVLVIRLRNQNGPQIGTDDVAYLVGASDRKKFSPQAQTIMDETNNKTVQPGKTNFKIEIADLNIFMMLFPGPPVIPGKTNLSLPDDNPESDQNNGPKVAPANVHGFVGKGRFQNYANVPGGRF